MSATEAAAATTTTTAAAMLTAHQCLPIQATTMGRHLLLPPATPPARGRERACIATPSLLTVLRQVRLHIITYDYAHCSCATQNAVEKLKFRDPST